MNVSLPDVDYRPPRLGANRPSVGLIGCGGISRSHLRAYRGIGLDVAALCDLDPRLAERRRIEYYPEAAVYTDVEQLLSSGIEVVDVATRPAERVAIIEQAVAAGCHVLSQKPFATDLATARRLVAAADAQGVKLAVNQNGRWVPHWAYARRLIATGALGAVRSDTGDYSPRLEGAWMPDGFIGAMTELLAAIEEDREPEHGGRDNLATLDLTLQAIAAAGTARTP